MPVGLPAKTTYANGDVFSASDINDTNGTLNLLTSSTLSVAAGKNGIINGAFDCWQRGTTPTLVPNNSLSYGPDRFIAFSPVAGRTISRQATNDTTNLPFIQYCARFQRNSGNTATDYLGLYQIIETLNSIPFAGRTVTLSFYARRGSNYTAASNALLVQFVSGTGTDQNIIFPGFTNETSIINATATLTTTWQRFTFTASVASTATQLALNLAYQPVGTAGANDFFEVTGLQLELGSVATSFSRAGATIQGELAACQRYYWRTANTTTFAIHGSGNAYLGTAAAINVVNPVPMRTAPTSVDWSNLRLDDNVAGFTFTTLVINSVVNSSNLTTVQATGVSGLTQYRFYNLSNNNNTAGFIGFSAEL